MGVNFQRGQVKSGVFYCASKHVSKCVRLCAGVRVTLFVSLCV